VRFQCGWLQEGSALPEDMRPDLAGVIVLLDRPWRDWKVIYAIPTGTSVPAASLERLRKHAQSVGRPMIFYERLVSDGEFTGLRKRAYGSAAFADAVRYSIGPEDVVKM